MSNGIGKGLVFGLINHSKRYLTQENFGFKINVQGKSMKSKQKWYVEQPDSDDVVYIRSHLDRYLSADEKGNVACEAEERGTDEKFMIEAGNDGRWAIKSHTHGYYLSGTDDDIRCFSKTKGNPELWTVHVGIHPQVHLRYVKGMRYAKLSGEELRVTEDLPWGQDALITLGFHEGKYTFQTRDDKYLHREGKMVEDLSEDTRFVLELHSGKVAFRDCEGCYLSPVGPNKTLKGRTKSTGKEEVFILEDSYPQGAFVAHNGKFVSSKQGQDLSANQDTIEDEETFQLEFNAKSGQWALRASIDKYWTLAHTAGIQVTTKKDVPESLFTLEYEGKFVTIKASNGKYVTAKPSGHLFAISDSVTDKEKFKFQLINRPLLVLRGEHGFVGVKPAATTNKLECNCNKYGLIHVIYEDGAYKFKGKEDKFWSVDNQGNLSMGGPDACEFTLEFHEQSKVSLRAPNGCLLKGEQSGIFRANGDCVEAGTLWEY
ncbi:fascin-like [Glandiceps talaboti]